MAALLSGKLTTNRRRSSTVLRRTLQVQHRLNPEQVENLVAEYRAGRSVIELAARYRLSRTTVHSHLKQHGLGRPQWERKLTDTQVQAAAKLYAAGSSLVAVGQRFNVDAATIRRAFIRAGVPVRPRRGQ
jgi:hypothetical protein